jgi:hypothetical protein
MCSTSQAAPRCAARREQQGASRSSQQRATTANERRASTAASVANRKPTKNTASSAATGLAEPAAVPECRDLLLQRGCSRSSSSSRAIRAAACSATPFAALADYHRRSASAQSLRDVVHGLSESMCFATSCDPRRPVRTPNHEARDWDPARASSAGGDLRALTGRARRGFTGRPSVGRLSARAGKHESAASACAGMRASFRELLRDLPLSRPPSVG